MTQEPEFESLTTASKFPAGPGIVQLRSMCVAWVKASYLSRPKGWNLFFLDINLCGLRDFEVLLRKSQ